MVCHFFLYQGRKPTKNHVTQEGECFLGHVFNY
jgi:hypothetical protein